MSDVNASAPGGGEGIAAPVTVITPAADTGASLSVAEAARALSAARRPKEQAAPDPVEPPELAKADDAQPETADPVEPTEEPDPVETQPLIEPPRSWTSERKEDFAKLPRELQEYVADRARVQETDFRRSQNEAAEKLKGLTAKEQQVEQARQQYESALPALLQTLQEQQQGEFNDVRTMADVEKLAREDWPRYALWDAQQKKIAAVSQEVTAAQQRQQTEFKQKWNEFASKEDNLAKDHIPELADPAKASKLADAVMTTLEKVGITKDDFVKAWTGEASISPRDHRWQQVMTKAALYDQAKASAAIAAKPVVPPVQRPGVAKPQGSTASEEIQNLTAKLERSGSLKDAQALRTAQLRAGTRRAS